MSLPNLQRILNFYLLRNLASNELFFYIELIRGWDYEKISCIYNIFIMFWLLLSQIKVSLETMTPTEDSLTGKHLWP
ncbi:Hypothetical Membrane Associated Protein [Fusobacterium vincentii ATCC 49256]|uniref:Hypothetical Membrane Associated Protein n=1 Tax=Fusobacterium vincentii ATCC 49256 TaxID=209882 RepID=Q7P2R3_FUSVC|nr:Hypothetical Membrane Associated Protein [Fusobacterium vincentii ATCC 49256]